MSDDSLDLLREFRAEISEPEQEAQTQVLREILATTRPEPAARERRWLRLPQRRVTLAAAVGFATVAAAVAVVLAVPWQHGPGALTSAQASLVLKRAVAAVTPRPGWFDTNKKLFSVQVGLGGAYTYAGLPG